ncbi:phage tail protein [Pseudomonas arsenicoxydans]|uniref:Phage tail protein n=2 Tax=Pseudomonas arsenicoxydans TaxID=702115 RepID=A0A4P6GRH9_9PSED|nr:phage tail protein [Pseudomonas arsenicoxydans]
MSITAASASATFTADEIAVKSALGGASWLLSSFSKNINLGNVGAGGMDTGSSPASGYVAVYVIYNPVSGVSALLGKNATASIQPEVYSGANMPSGYTASALIGVWPTNGSGQFVVGFMQGRQVSIAGLQVLSSSVQQASFVSLSLAAAVPPNAKTAKGYMRVGSSSPANNLGQISSNSVGLDQTVVEGGYTNATSAFSVAMLTLQTLFYTATTSTGTFNSSITITSYTF